MAFQSPNFTPIPNDLFEMAPDMNEAELRVTLFLLRQTFGYRTASVELTVNAVAAGTSLSRRGVYLGTEAAEKRGSITKATKAKHTIWTVNIAEGASVTYVATSKEAHGTQCNTFHADTKKDINVPPKPNQREMVGALCEVMGLDSRLMGARLARLAAALSRLGADPATVRSRYGRGGWYYANDWRGKQGQLPSEAAIRATWGAWAAEPVEHKYSEEF